MHHHTTYMCPLLVIYHLSHIHLSLSLSDIPTAGIESDLDEAWFQRQLQTDSMSMVYVGSGKSGKSNGSGGKSGKSNGSGSASGSGGKSGKSGSKSVRSCYL